MATACASCRAENPDGFKFCAQCGVALAGLSPIAQERKVVTTLFCDLVSFTVMSETADPEDVDRNLGEYFARSTRVIESYGEIFARLGAKPALEDVEALMAQTS